MKTMTVLAAVRVGLGAICLLAPRTARRLSLLSAKHSDPTADTMTRFYATRALAMGSVYLADPSSRSTLARVGVVVDLTDTAFLTAMALRGRLSPSSAAWLGAITGGAAAVGVVDLVATES